MEGGQRKEKKKLKKFQDKRYLSCY